MDESGAIQTQPLGYIKMCVAVIKLLRLKSLTFGGHLKIRSLYYFYYLILMIPVAKTNANKMQSTRIP